MSIKVKLEFRRRLHQLERRDGFTRWRWQSREECGWSDPPPSAWTHTGDFILVRSWAAHHVLAFGEYCCFINHTLTSAMSASLMRTNPQHGKTPWPHLHISLPTTPGAQQARHKLNEPSKLERDQIMEHKHCAEAHHTLPNIGDHRQLQTHLRPHNTSLWPVCSVCLGYRVEKESNNNCSPSTAQKTTKQSPATLRA